MGTSLVVPATPRFATPRDQSRPTLGHEVEQVANTLGYTLSTWQRLVADTALELNQQGHLIYRRIVLSCGRQVGKSFLLGCLHIWRLLYGTEHGWGLRQLDVHTAQTRESAVRMLQYDWYPMLEGTSYDDQVTKFGRARGSESLEFGADRLVITPPTLTGGHGLSQVSLATLDEAFAFADSRVEVGLMPTQLVAVSPQTWVTSAAGASGLDSPYWFGLVEHCRERFDLPDQQTAFFEWAATDEDDPDDEATWYRACPALGDTLTLDAIKFFHQSMSPDDFARSILNKWTGAGSRIINAAAWAQCADVAVDLGDRLWLAIDASPVGPHGRAGSIAVGGWTPDGNVGVKLIKNAPGVDWLPDFVEQATRKRKYVSLTLDAIGPVRSLVPDIKARAKCRVEVMDSNDYVAACTRFVDNVSVAGLRYAPDHALNAAVDGAARRIVGDGFAFSRRHSTADLSPLVACTLAHWQAATHEKRASFAIL